jgi:hypothetical protein
MLLIIDIMFYLYLPNQYYWRLLTLVTVTPCARITLSITKKVEPITFFKYRSDPRFANGSLATYSEGVADKK